MNTCVRLKMLKPSASSSSLYRSVNLNASTDEDHV